MIICLFIIISSQPYTIGVEHNFFLVAANFADAMWYNKYGGRI